MDSATYSMDRDLYSDQHRAGKVEGKWDTEVDSVTSGLGLSLTESREKNSDREKSRSLVTTGPREKNLNEEHKKLRHFSAVLSFPAHLRRCILGAYSATETWRPLWHF